MTKAVILAGGLGTRISEETAEIRAVLTFWQNDGLIRGVTVSR